ncbi:MAG: acyl carrier protein [Desulfobacterales bacterium]|nr:acyl carrier protein [Desulfobacterales bacterium]MBF0395660.1 acyl carrier protein [Desulfobacterales bacterium]
MMIENVVNKLKQIIVSDLDVDLKLEDIDLQVSLFEGGLGFDSVIIVEFISLIEERFKFKFSNEELDMELFANLDLLSKFIYKKLTGNHL